MRVQLPDGSVTATEYDDLGLPIATVEPDGATWRQRYDAHGNLVEAVDPTGAVTRYSYAAGGRPTSHTDALGSTRSLVTDAAGLPLEISDSLGGVTRCSRDSFGRVVELTDPMGVTTRMGWTVDGLPAFREEVDGSREIWEYDAEGNELLHQDPSGAIVRHEVGPFDLPRTRTDPDGAVYQFTYDTEQQLRSVTNPQGRAWTFDLDAVGRLTAERDFNGSDRTYQYDAAGQLTRRSNEAGESVAFTYDLLGNTVTQNCSDGSITTFRHNAVGQLVWARNSDAEVEIQRDPLGRILRESVNGRVVSSVYDALGRRTQRVTPSGVVSRWDYDSEDRPTRLRLQGHTLDFEHDACGRDVGRRLGPSTVLTQSWSPDGHLVGQEILTEAPEGRTRRWHRNFAYTPGGRLSTMETPGGESRRFRFDAVGRVTSVAGGQWQERYDYDSVGNVVRAAAPMTEADGGHDTNNIGTDERETSGTLVRKAGGYRYEHDKQGRVVRRFKKTLSGIRKVWSYVWSPENRLTDLVTPEGAHWKYRYDPLGRRIAKQRVDDGGLVSDAALFDWDGENLAEEATVTGRVRTWEYEPDTHRPVLQTDRGADQQEYDRRFYAIVTDLIGTPTEILSEEGEIAWRSRTTLWGLDAGPARPGDVDCPLRFPGQYFDEESGWHYNFYRYYDPQTAQYTTPDPLGLLPEDNQHSYVRNPLSWLDALGLAPCAKVIALRAWKARNNQGGYSVYHGLDSQGRKIYAGITNNIARRERQHIAKNYGIVRLQEVRGATGLKKWQARAIEQGLIEDVRASGLSRARNGVSIPQINSIAPKRLIYGTAVRYGRIFLS
ncbi:Rhs protein OS=Streptomyces tendae OX=1932 GN=GUR47_17240 PE=4 SV=1 [Streptomyces tendae]